PVWPSTAGGGSSGPPVPRLGRSLALPSTEFCEDLSWSREDIIGQLSRQAGQHRLGLGTEAGQLLGGTLIAGLVIAQPARGAVEAGAGFLAVPQPVVGHGQEQEVEAIGLAVTGFQALLQGRDRLGVAARSVMDDAERVEQSALVRGNSLGALDHRQRAVEL